MENQKKLLRILAVSGVVMLTSASVFFATQPASGAGKEPAKPAGVLGKHNGTISPNAYPGNRPDFPVKTDGDLEDAVERAVKHHKDVDVSVKNRVVTLSGEVVNEADRKEAISEARAVPGVITVQDQMQVTGAGEQSVGEVIDDAAITTAVKSKILVEKGLSSLDISVDTIDGVVTLTGDVESKALADKAGAVASQVKGVKRVDNKLLVKP